MLGRHLGRALTEPQRARWVRLLGEAADEAGLPSDPEFRSAFVGYLEWGSRIALANGQPGADPPRHMPVPRWDWGPAGLPGSALGTPQPLEDQHPASLAEGALASFERNIRPLFTDRDRTSMQWAFDLFDYTAVREHAEAIFEQVNAGKMPCYGPWQQERVRLLRTWIDAGMPP